jgi:glycosyltransferase involved in cell wall biosynthesis
LFSVRELHYGGIERDVTEIALHIDRSHWEPHVAFFRSGGMRYDELVSAGIPLLHIPLNSLASTRAILPAMTLWKYFRQNCIRILHGWDDSASFTVPVGRLANVPVLLGSQLTHRALSDKRSLMLRRLNDRLVDGMVVNCEAMRRHLIADEGYPTSRIALCYNGVDTSEFFPRREPRVEQVRDASIVIGTVCVLREEKSIDLLQEAFSRVRNMRAGMKLLIVGSGPELSYLEKNVMRLGIESGTIFVPSTAQVSKYMRSIDIFVSPSRSEAFSNSLLEAMACGCSAVGSRVGGTPEMLGENERGLLFTSGDVDGLAKCLARLIGDSELRANLGRKAADFARTELNIERACARMSEIYDRWLALKDRS